MMLYVQILPCLVLCMLLLWPIFILDPLPVARTPIEQGYDANPQNTAPKQKGVISQGLH